MDQVLKMIAKVKCWIRAVDPNPLRYLSMFKRQGMVWWDVAARAAKEGGLRTHGYTLFTQGTLHCFLLCKCGFGVPHTRILQGQPMKHCCTILEAFILLFLTCLQVKQHQ